MSDPFVGQSLLDVTGGNFSMTRSDGLPSTIGNNSFNLLASGLSQPQVGSSSLAPAPSVKQTLARSM